MLSFILPLFSVNFSLFIALIFTNGLTVMHLISRLKSEENLLWKNLWGRCLNRRKRCEFHYLQSINRHANEVGENSEEIKSLAKDYLYLGAQKAYLSIHEQYEALLGSCTNEKELHNWLQWWHKRRHNIFWAFTGFEVHRWNRRSWYILAAQFAIERYCCYSKLQNLIIGIQFC